ncbi:MAG TPA: hypothetical protein VF556_08535 [Pyrinomonadaceae bacterium]|jgi:hypothetical protein
MKKMIQTKTQTKEAFGLVIEVEHIGRGATATVKTQGEFFGVYKFASTMNLAFELVKDEIAKIKAEQILFGLTK